jgi:putative tryptophan/tyrosine transport system substrate-binding protein
MRRRDLIASLAATAAGLPLAARAQQRKMPVVGFLWSTSPAAAAPVIAGFYQGLGEAGYVERQNVTIDTVGRKATMIGCLHWPPTLSAARST